MRRAVSAGQNGGVRAQAVAPVAAALLVVAGCGGGGGWESGGLSIPFGRDVPEVGALGPLPALPPRDEAVAAMRREVAAARLSLSLEHVTLDAFVESVRAATGVPVSRAPGVEGDTGPITLHVRGMPVTDALTWVCRQIGLQYQFLPEIGPCVTREPCQRLFETPETRILYIGDLVQVTELPAGLAEVMQVRRTVDEAPAGTGSAGTGAAAAHAQNSLRDLDRQMREMEEAYGRSRDLPAQVMLDRARAYADLAGRILRPFSPREVSVRAGPGGRALLVRGPASVLDRLELVLSAVRAGTGVGPEMPPTPSPGADPREGTVFVRLRSCPLGSAGRIFLERTGIAVGFAPWNEDRRIDATWEGIPARDALADLAARSGHDAYVWEAGRGAWLVGDRLAPLARDAEFPFDRCGVGAYRVPDLIAAWGPGVFRVMAERRLARHAWRGGGQILWLDPATSTLVVHHEPEVIRDVEGYLEELRRTLRPAGASDAPP